MTAPNQTSQRARPWVLAAALGGFLYFAYLLSFTGIPKTDDEYYIIDTTDSFAVRSGPDRLLLNETVHLRPGLVTTDVEPAQPLLAVPLYWLAYQIPWIGNVHAILLFNPLITALTAMLLYVFARRLGYSERTALAAGLLFGVATIVWPYTKTFFREPLTMLNLLAAVYFIERWRQTFSHHDHRHWIWLAAVVAVVLVAILSKEAMLIALPVLAVQAFPNWSLLVRRRRDVVIIAAILTLLAAALIVALTYYQQELEAVFARYLIVIRLSQLLSGLPKAWYATLGYLFSPGKGVFWYSPILILALGAPALLPRSRWRESWLMLALLVIFAIGYAAIRRELWHGGAGWGSRYMVPLVPLLMVAALPMLNAILETDRWLPKALLALLIIASIAVQAGELWVDLHAYYAYQQGETGLTAWNDTIIWSMRWSQAVGALRLAPNTLPDILWLFPKVEWVVLAAIGAGLLFAGLLLIGWDRYLSWRHGWMLPGIMLPVVVIGVTLFALEQAYDDPRYEGHNQELHAMRAYISERARPEDVILLSTPRYAWHFMNYYKNTPIWYSMPLSPGERYNENEVPEVVSDQAADLVHWASKDLIGRFMASDRLIWLVSDHGPSLPWATRPVERFLAEYTFPVEEKDFTPLIRIVGYAPMFVPAPSTEPAYRVAARFGEGMELVGYDLFTNQGVPVEGVLPRSKMLGVSLLWEALGPMAVDYKVAVYLINDAGQVALQQDRPPVGGFAPTSLWEPNERLRDNFGYTIPGTLPPGDYEIWVAVYSWPSLERLEVIGGDGSSIGDHLVLQAIRIE